MGNVIYCETKETTAPYIFTNTRIAVYSYEEVCYYIFHHPSMMSLEYFGAEFTDWLREKLNMEELADALEERKASECSLIAYLETFLLAANYYDKHEVALFFERLKTEQSLPKSVQMKKQADSFLDFHKYVRAIRIYDDILKQEGLTAEFRSAIYHNKGVALSKNFELKPALQCFKMAYETEPNEVSLSCYLTIFFMLNQYVEAKKEAERLEVPVEQYERLLKDYKRSSNSFEQTEQYEEYRKIKDALSYGQDKKAEARIDQLLHEWKEEYRVQTT